MTLCLISATDSCNVTLARKSGLASPLESALAKNASASPLESALANSLDLKSPEINTYRKCGGVPSLLFTIFVCESVFISVHLWLHLLPFFCLLLYFLCSVYRPWRPIALVQLSALGGRGGGVWGETLQIGRKRQRDGAVQARLHRCAIMLWAMHCGCGGHEL